MESTATFSGTAPVKPAGRTAFQVSILCSVTVAAYLKWRVSHLHCLSERHGGDLQNYSGEGLGGWPTSGSVLGLAATSDRLQHHKWLRQTHDCRSEEQRTCKRPQCMCTCNTGLRTLRAQGEHSAAAASTCLVCQGQLDRQATRLALAERLD